MRNSFIPFLLFALYIKAQAQIDQIPGIIIQNDFEYDNSLKPIQVFYDNYVLIQCFNDRNRQAQLWLTDGVDNHTQLLLELQQSENIYHIQIVDKTAFVFVHSVRDSLLKIFRIYDNIIGLDTSWTLKATLRDFRLFNDKIYFSGDDFTFIPEFYNYNYDINKKIINRIMKNAKSAYTKPIVWNNQLFYLGSISEIDGTSLGKYNENKDSLELITVLDPAYLYYSDPKLVVQDSTFFYLFLNFVKLPGGEYYEYLIRSDGTKNGTYKLKEIKGPGILPENEAILWKNQLYFDGSDPKDSIGA